MSTKLRADAKEWTPGSAFQLPPSNQVPVEAEKAASVTSTPPVHPSKLVFMYDENGEGELVEHDGQFGFDEDEESDGQAHQLTYAGGGVGYDEMHGGFYPPPGQLGMPPMMTPEAFQEEIQRLRMEQIQRQLDEQAAKELARSNPPQQQPSSQSAAASSATAREPPKMQPSEKFAGKPLPPLTAKGNLRWKKPTRAQQRQDQAQKAAFESFASALLHSTSPFMAQLRTLCKTSLPHIKLDQRYGKRGAPETAVTQFVVAPMVVNYRPRHFHEISPGDLLEFHFDFSLVLKQIATANCISFSYGPEWKPFLIPYCYVGCRDYKAEVLKLCPHEVPNSRSEAVYEDDIVKDVTDVILSVEQLTPLRTMSFLQAMSRRVNLSHMYEAFDEIFAPVSNYQIQIRDFNKVPSTFLLKTSQQVISKLPGEVILYDDPTLWNSLPLVENTFQSGRGRVVGAGEVAGTSQPTAASQPQGATGAALSVSKPPAPAAAAPPAAPAEVPVTRVVNVASPQQALPATAQQAPPAKTESPAAAPVQPMAAGQPAAAPVGVSPVTWVVCAACVAVTAVALLRLKSRK